tara:strand:- start:1205 stop:1498 length:294 start_codon:yes stop_codon:yes gene_type:complete
MESMASDYEQGSQDAADYEAALSQLQASATLRPGDLLTVTLPDGQAVQIDARDQHAVVVHHCDSSGDHVATLDVEPEPEPDGPHPSLSAAERNPSLR